MKMNISKQFNILNLIIVTLAGIAQWIEHRPVNQKVTGSINFQSEMPGVQARSPVVGAQNETTH